MATILLVDDNTPLRELMALALVSDGHRVIEAGEGKEALRLLERNAIDLLVTDIVMPDQDGLATIPIVRKRWPKLKIVVISGDSPRYAELYLKTAGLLGAHKTLRKPFSISELLQAVRDTLPPAPPAR